MTTPITLPSAVAAALAHRLHVELPMRLPCPATTINDHARWLAAGTDLARQRGLLSNTGPSPAIASALRLLHDPAITVHLARGEFATRRQRVVLAVSRADAALFAELRDDALVLTPVRATAIAAELCRLLPALAAADGPRSATSPTAALRAALSRCERLPGRLAAELTSRGVPSADAHLIARALTAPRTAITHFYTTPTTTLDVLDTTAGRYLLTGRGDHVVVTAGYPGLIRAGIDDLLRASQASAA